MNRELIQNPDFQVNRESTFRKYYWIATALELVTLGERAGLSKCRLREEVRRLSVWVSLSVCLSVCLYTWRNCEYEADDEVGSRIDYSGKRERVPIPRNLRRRRSLHPIFWCGKGVIHNKINKRRGARNEQLSNCRWMRKCAGRENSSNS